MSVPSKRTVPAVGSISRSTRRAVVDLPQPDSPTSARVSPRSSVKEMPSTARTHADGAAEQSGPDVEMPGEVGDLEEGRGHEPSPTKWERVG